MTGKGNVHDNNVTEAQVAILKAVTPLIVEMSTEARQRIIIGNSRLQYNLRAGLALAPTILADEMAVEKPKPVEKPTLIFIKQTLLGTTSITTYGLGRDLSFSEMLRPVVKVGDEVLIDEIEQLLKQRKHTISEAKFTEILDKQAKFFLQQRGGEDFGLRADWWNLVLVENESGVVSVVRAPWDGERWDRYRYSLGCGDVWRRERRLVLSNSDASNL